MTQQEKDRLHLKKQDRRLRKLIFRVLLPVLWLQLLCIPLYGYLLMLWLSEPLGPFEIIYADHEISVSRDFQRDHIIIKAEDGRRFSLFVDLGRSFWLDLKGGRIRPGDTLIIGCYTWPIYDRVATLRTGDRVYIDAADFENDRAEDVRIRLTFGAIALGLGVLGSGASYLVHRRQLAETCRLRRKYKMRLMEKQQT